MWPSQGKEAGLGSLLESPTRLHLPGTHGEWWKQEAGRPWGEACAGDESWCLAHKGQCAHDLEGYE